MSGEAARGRRHAGGKESRCKHRFAKFDDDTIRDQNPLAKQLFCPKTITWGRQVMRANSEEVQALLAANLTLVLGKDGRWWKYLQTIQSQPDARCL